MSDVQDRISGSTRRIDNLLNIMGRREAERQRAEDAERMMAEREQARADSEKKRVIQTRYDDAFSAFGTRAPQPVEGERPGAISPPDVRGPAQQAARPAMSGAVYAPTTFPLQRANRSKRW